MFWSSGLWRRVVRQVSAKISEEHKSIVAIFWRKSLRNVATHMWGYTAS
jgi:hypothetical protein